MSQSANSPQKRIAEIRNQIQALQGRISAVADLAVPIEKAFERIDAMVDDLAEAGAVDGSLFAASKYARPRIDDPDEVLQLFAWLDPDRMKTRLRDATSEFYKHWSGSFDVPEVHASVARDRAALFKLEIAEEQLISQAEMEGLEIQRRSGADPLAVMQAVVL